MRESEDLGAKIGRLARLGRQRDFPLARFQKSLDSVAHNGERGEVLRQLLTDWTGIPFDAEEALQRWSEIERLVAGLRGKLGAPLGLQTVLLHHLHSQKGMLKEPRLVSEADLAAAVATRFNGTPAAHPEPAAKAADALS